MYLMGWMHATEMLALLHKVLAKFMGGGKLLGGRHPYLLDV